MNAFFAAFLLRDLRSGRGDRLTLAARAVAGATVMLGLVLMARAYGEAPSLAGEVSALAFLLTGLALMDLFVATVSSPGDGIWQAGLLGSLEAMLCCPRGLTWLVLGEAVPRAAGALARGTVVVLCLPLLDPLVGPTVARSSLWPHWLLAPVLVLALAAFSSLGLWVAALTVLLRRSGLAGRFVSGVVVLCSGVFFPVATLPAPVRDLAAWSPLTLALRGVRNTLLVGGDPTLARDTLPGLALATALLAPLGLLLLHLAHRRARRLGTLLIR